MRGGVPRLPVSASFTFVPPLSRDMSRFKPHQNAWPAVNVTLSRLPRGIRLYTLPLRLSLCARLVLACCQSILLKMGLTEI